MKGTQCPAGTTRMGAEPPEGKEAWCEKSGGVKEGPYEAWHDDGTKSISGAYKDGQRDGPWVLWHENGQRKQELTYVKGKPNGRFREWDKKGEPIADVMYKNGKVVR